MKVVRDLSNSDLSLIADKACELYGYRNNGNNATQSGRMLYLGSDYIGSLVGGDVHFDREGFFPAVASLVDLYR